MSIPKKELNGIVLASEKAHYLAEALGISKEQIYIHTDSLVSIHWIHKNKSSLKLYVSNRVNKIQQSGIKILFTPGTKNPADLISKPKPSKDYVNNPFWTTGPDYLQQEDNAWLEKHDLNNILKGQLQKEEMKSIQEEVKEGITSSINVIKKTAAEPEGIFSIIHRFNSWNTIINITAQYFRAIALMTKGIKDESRKEELRKGFEIHRISAEVGQNMTPVEKNKLHITPSIKELDFAKNYLISESQKIQYQEEYEALQKKEQISEKSKLIKLNPQLREMPPPTVMIMKGRLDNLHTMPEQVRNPIILTKDSKVTQMLILWYHQTNTHSGPEVTLRNIRMKNWLPGGKQQVR